MNVCQAAGGGSGMPAKAEKAENTLDWLENQSAEKDEFEPKQKEDNNKQKAEAKNDLKDFCFII
eukprot:3598559-Alexandrium_andersonii.AAC.1